MNLCTAKNPIKNVQFQEFLADEKVYNDLKIVKKYFGKNKVPIVIGEYAAFRKNTRHTAKVIRNKFLFILK